MKVRVTFGQDLSCYAECEIDVPNSASAKEVLEAIEKYAESDNFANLEFEPDWGTTCALRVVSATKDGEEILQDAPLEPSPFDVGQIVTGWLNNYGLSLKTVIDHAVKFKLIAKTEAEAYTGYLKVPGADRVQVDFVCREGATREEKDLAFLQALTQIATVDYVPVGDAPKCSTCERDSAVCGDGDVCKIARQEV